MSVGLTVPQVQDRTKTVTRRLGWWTDKRGRRLLWPGHRLTLCRKVQGRKPGEPLQRLAEVQVLEVWREPLWDITEVEVAREGFPQWTTWRFIDFFCEQMRCHPPSVVTRIHWTYLDSSGRDAECSTS